MAEIKRIRGGEKAENREDEKRRDEKRREEKRRDREGRGGVYQEDSGDPCITVSLANVRRNSSPSESDRARFSPYVSNTGTSRF